MSPNEQREFETGILEKKTDFSEEDLAKLVQAMNVLTFAEIKKEEIRKKRKNERTEAK